MEQEVVSVGIFWERTRGNEEKFFLYILENCRISTHDDVKNLWYIFIG